MALGFEEAVGQPKDYQVFQVPCIILGGYPVPSDITGTAPQITETGRWILLWFKLAQNLPPFASVASPSEAHKLGTKSPKLECAVAGVCSRR
jgi:hypothetical protein